MNSLHINYTQSQTRSQFSSTAFCCCCCSHCVPIAGRIQFCHHLQCVINLSYSVHCQKNHRPNFTYRLYVISRSFRVAIIIIISYSYFVKSFRNTFNPMHATINLFRHNWSQKSAWFYRNQFCHLFFCRFVVIFAEIQMIEKKTKADFSYIPCENASKQVKTNDRTQIHLDAPKLL